MVYVVTQGILRHGGSGGVVVGVYGCYESARAHVANIVLTDNDHGWRQDRADSWYNRRIRRFMMIKAWDIKP